MAQKTLRTSYLAQLTNANHDGVTQQIDDRLQGFETDNTMLQQAAAAVHTARQAEDAAYRRYSGKDFASDDLKRASAPAIPSSSLGSWQRHPRCLPRALSHTPSAPALPRPTQSMIIVSLL